MLDEDWIQPVRTAGLSYYQSRSPKLMRARIFFKDEEIGWGLSRDGRGGAKGFVKRVNAEGETVLHHVETFESDECAVQCPMSYMVAHVDDELTQGLAPETCSCASPPLCSCGHYSLWRDIVTATIDMVENQGWQPGIKSS